MLSCNNIFSKLPFTNSYYHWWYDIRHPNHQSSHFLWRCRMTTHQWYMSYLSLGWKAVELFTKFQTFHHWHHSLSFPVAPVSHHHQSWYIRQVYPFHLLLIWPSQFLSFLFVIMTFMLFYIIIEALFCQMVSFYILPFLLLHLFHYFQISSVNLWPHFPHLVCLLL